MIENPIGSFRIKEKLLVKVLSKIIDLIDIGKDLRDVGYEIVMAQEPFKIVFLTYLLSNEVIQVVFILPVEMVTPVEDVILMNYQVSIVLVITASG